MSEKKKDKKEKAEAITSFILGLLVWIPLLNWGLGILAIFFGIRALKKSFDKPDQYGGRIYAIIGACLGIIVIIFNVIYLLAILGVIKIAGISS